jgi:ribosomal protein S18 acetylase RimI-like enzyme
MHIRTARQSDAESVAQLHAASWRIAYRGMLSDAYLDGPIDAERSELWRGRFARPERNQFIVVAESQGKVMGFACAYGGQDPQWGTFIDNLHVAPEHKRKGIGARLMERLASWSGQSHPGRGLFLWVLESNTEARKFYERVGAQVAGSDVWTPPDGSALPKLRMAWRSAEALAAGTGSVVVQS